MTEIIQIITVIGLIIALYWQSRDRKTKGAKFIIPEARVSIIQRVMDNTALDDLPKEEALKYTGIIHIVFLLMNVGDMNGFIRFNNAILIDSSNISYYLHNQSKKDIYEEMFTPKQQTKSSLVFAIPRNVWFTKKGTLQIEAEYTDFKGKFSKLNWEIPITLSNRYK